MRYMNGGVDIQYRECQIMREAAKSFVKEESGSLVDNVEQWLAKMNAEASEQGIKGRIIPPMTQFLAQMDSGRLKAVAEFVEYLAARGRGIDIMVPFKASNHYTVLPVNIHEAPGMESAGQGCGEERE